MIRLQRLRGAWQGMPPQTPWTLKRFLPSIAVPVGTSKSFMITISMVAFTNGVLDLPELAIAFLWKDFYKLTPGQVAAIDGPRFFPWLIKPVYGFISDCAPIFGYRRKSYLFIMGCLGAVTWFTLGLVHLSVWLVILSLVMAQLSIAFMNVIAEAFIVEEGRGKTQGSAGSFFSMFFGVRYIGYIIAAYSGGLLLEYMAPQKVFLLSSLFPLLVAVCAYFAVESKADPGDTRNVREQVELLGKALSHRSIWGPAIYIFCVRAHPNVESAFFFFFTNELGFRAELLGRLRLVGALSGLTGIFVYNKYLKTARYRSVLKVSTILASFIGLTRLILITKLNRLVGIPDFMFAVGDNALGSAVAEVMAMPLLVVAARICPKGVEGTLYALLMSINNAGGMIASQLGALLMHFVGVTQNNFKMLWLLVLICDLSTLLPLFFLKYVPDDDVDTEQGQTVDSMEVAAEREPLNTSNRYGVIGGDPRMQVTANTLHSSSTTKTVV